MALAGGRAAVVYDDWPSSDESGRYEVAVVQP